MDGRQFYLRPIIKDMIFFHVSKFISLLNFTYLVDKNARTYLTGPNLKFKIRQKTLCF